MDQPTLYGRVYFPEPSINCSHKAQNIYYVHKN